MHVVVEEEEWSDDTRARTIPVRAYRPDTNDERHPLIVLSHATGGARDWYEYLGRHWASHGYVSLHLQHRGSDIDCWRGKGGGAIPAMKRAAADPQSIVDRTADMLFALDRVALVGSFLAPHIDRDRIGASGHSLGAKTALAVAGEIFITTTGDEKKIADPRIKAVLAMSAPRPWSTTDDDLARIYAAIAVPCFHITGTRDESPLGETTAVERRIPFDAMTASDQHLVTFEGADHMVFAGAKRLFDGDARDPIFHDLVAQSTLHFWNAYLKNDAISRAWLIEAPFKTLLADRGILETKLVAQTTTRPV